MDPLERSVIRGSSAYNGLRSVVTFCDPALGFSQAEGRGFDSRFPLQFIRVNHVVLCWAGIFVLQRTPSGPEPSDTSKSLQADAKKAAVRLKKEKGPRFDKDYIDTEVAYHQAVIDAVKNTLVPGAQNADLKKLLENAVPTLEGHLQHAKMVQAQLGAHAGK